MLLVHGVLHLLGLDHETGAADAAAMSEAEAAVMAALGWRGAGLIAAADAGGGTSAPAASATQNGGRRIPPSRCHQEYNTRF